MRKLSEYKIGLENFYNKKKIFAADMHEGEIYLFIIGSYYIAIWTERSIIHYSLFRKTKKLYLNVCETEKEQCQDNSTIIYFSF